MDPRDAPFVYVCSPYSGETEKNTRRAVAYCRMVLAEGSIPIAPHLYLPAFLSEEKEREEALEIGLRLLSLCSEVWVFGESISPGMAGEIEEAKRQNIPVIRRKATGDIPPGDGGERKKMYAIEENRTKVNGVEFTTFQRKVDEGCTVLEAEAGTTGYTGGEGTRTFIRLDCKDGPVLLDPIKDEDGDVTGVVVAACCDTALSALIQVLEFCREALTDQILEADE